MSFVANLTYDSPDTDFVENIGTYPDGSINNEYTLLAMKKKIQDNLDIIDKLIENKNSIASVYADSGHLNVDLKSDSITDKLLEEKTIRVSDEKQNLEIYEEPETHNIRKKKIFNLINDSEIAILREDYNEISDTDEPQHVIDDPKNEKIIRNKYAKLIRTDTNDDSDDSEAYVSEEEEEICECSECMRFRQDIEEYME